MTGVSASEGGRPVAVVDSDQTVRTSPTADGPQIFNPKNEPTIKVRALVEFWNEGVKRRVGDDDFDMPISQARAAAQYVRMVRADGELVAVPHESQSLVTPARPVGLAPHEKVEVLESELTDIDQQMEALEQRRRIVAKEHDKANADLLVKIAAGKKDQSTTAEPPRPGEQPTKTPTPPAGEPAKPPQGEAVDNVRSGREANPPKE
jgi:hypothetical protein